MVALLEDRQRSSKAPGLLRQPAEPEANRSTDRLHAAVDTSLAKRIHELAHEERHPARHTHTRIDQGGIGSPTDARLQELGNGGPRQR